MFRNVEIISGISQKMRCTSIFSFNSIFKMFSLSAEMSMFKTSCGFSSSSTSSKTTHSASRERTAARERTAGHVSEWRRTVFLQNSICWPTLAPIWLLTRAFDAEFSQESEKRDNATPKHQKTHQQVKTVSTCWFPE